MNDDESLCVLAMIAGTFVLLLGAIFQWLAPTWVRNTVVLGGSIAVIGWFMLELAWRRRDRLRREEEAFFRGLRDMSAVNDRYSDLEFRLNAPTEPGACTCGHEGLGRKWHWGDCSLKLTKQEWKP